MKKNFANVRGYGAIVAFKLSMPPLEKLRGVLRYTAVLAGGAVIASPLGFAETESDKSVSPVV